MSALAADLGGSSLRIAAADPADPRVLRSPVDRSTPPGDLRAALARAAEHLGTPAAVVLAVPSFVWPDGTLADCPAVPSLTGLDLGALVRDATGAGRVSVVPDLAAAAVGESRRGSGVGVDRLLVVALGTGANAAAVVGGAVVDTAFGCLGDAGHVLVEPDGPVCACGGRGCLEAVASGWALARDATAAGLPTGAALTAAASAGDPAALALLTRAGTALGRAVATWSVLLWPDLVAVAGGVSEAGELLLGPARAELARVGTPYVVGRLRLERARLGADATLSGARLLAADLFSGG